MPGLHVVTDDEVLAAPAFVERALRLVRVHGPAIALHLRGPGTPAAVLHELAVKLAPAARDSGARLFVNDRLDIALAVEAVGVHLGTRSLPVAAARELREDWMISASVHDASGAVDAGGADFLVVGTIWETPSHPGRPGAGPEGLRRVGAVTERPLIAIGGVTPDRVAAAIAAGAAGVAVIRGIWTAGDPAEAASSYLEALTHGAGMEAV